MTDIPTKKKIGRPRNDPNEKRSAMINFAVTETERDRIHAHVAELDISIAEWLRRIALSTLPKKPE